MQLDAEHMHQEQGPRNRDQQHGADHQPDANTHEQQQHREHDRDGLGDVHLEATHCIRHRGRLVVDRLEHHPGRDQRCQFGQAFADPPSRLYHVFAMGHRYADGQCRVAIDVEHPLRNVFIGTRDLRNVTQAHEACGFTAEQYVAERRDRGGFTARRNAQQFVADPHAPGIDDCILRLQHGGDLLRRDAKLAELGTRDVHVDHLTLLALDVHLAHTTHAEQLALDRIGGLPQVTPGVPLTAECEIDAVDVAEIVDHHRILGARWQPWAHVGDLAAQLVEDRRKFLGPVGVLELDQDVRHAGTRDRHAQALDLLHALDGVLDVIAHLRPYLFGRSAGVQGDDLRHLERIGGVLELAHAEKTPGTTDAEHQHEQPRHERVAQRVFAGIHGNAPINRFLHHGAVPARCSACVIPVYRRPCAWCRPQRFPHPGADRRRRVRARRASRQAAPCAA